MTIVYSTLHLANSFSLSLYLYMLDCFGALLAITFKITFLEKSAHNGALLNICVSQKG